MHHPLESNFYLLPGGGQDQFGYDRITVSKQIYLVWPWSHLKDMDEKNVSSCCFGVYFLYCTLSQEKKIALVPFIRYFLVQATRGSHLHIITSKKSRVTASEVKFDSFWPYPCNFLSGINEVICHCFFLPLPLQSRQPPAFPESPLPKYYTGSARWCQLWRPGTEKKT